MRFSLVWVENGYFIILHAWSKIVKASRSLLEFFIKKKNKFEFVLFFYFQLQECHLLFPTQSLAKLRALRLLKLMRYFSCFHFLALIPFFQSAQSIKAYHVVFQGLPFYREFSHPFKWHLLTWNNDKNRSVLLKSANADTFSALYIHKR